MNNQIFFFFYNLSHHSTFLDNFFIFFAEYFPYLVIIAAGIFLLFHHEVFAEKNHLKAFVQKWKEILAVFFSGVVAWAFATVLKYIFHTERPAEIFSNVIPLIEKTGYAFPSGHATFFMAVALALFFQHKRIGIIFIVFALLIGIARIVVGVHFPLDILGGFALGLAIAFLLKNI